jgi:hypothetical protein
MLGRKRFLFSKTSKPAPGSTHLPTKWVQRVKQPKRETDHLPPTSEVTSDWSCNSTPPTCLYGVRRKTFTFSFITLSANTKEVNAFHTYHSSSQLKTSAADWGSLNIVQHSPSTEQCYLIQHRLTQWHTNTLLTYSHALVSNRQTLLLVVQCSRCCWSFPTPHWPLSKGSLWRHWPTSPRRDVPLIQAFR